MTVIELMGALTLATLLLVALMGVVRSMTTGAKQLVASTPMLPWQTLLHHCLRDDLANARRYVESPGQLRLIGYGSSSPVDGQPTLRPAEIIYSITTIEDSTWLVREEIALDGRSNRQNGAQLVCRDVSRIEIRAPGDDQRREYQAGPIPDRCVVRLIGRGDNPNVDLPFLR